MINTPAAHARWRTFVTCANIKTNYVFSSNKSATARLYCVILLKL